ncbi:MAG: diaminopropionate ammonia-lyase [Oscillospiraceae bacterium]|nr:diaminopropionate ammonia-lyase [Oscillospiraceae bacterium]
MKETKITNTIVLSTDMKGTPGSPFDQEAAENALRFHRSLPMYEKTKLVSLRTAAEELGVKAIHLKDESTRFGLKAFKGLGGSYAVFRVLCEKLGLDHRDAVFSDFTTEEIREKCSDVVFVTATDGNHGRGVAWASSLFGCKAYVFMPAGSAEARRKAIEDAGAEKAVICDLNYDKVVQFARRQAEENGWTLIQDTSWEGYEKIPQWIVEGYLTMGAEICEQLDGDVPTHVFLQAGVGAMAGGILGYLSNVFAAKEPVFTIVEPSMVACLYESAKAGDGNIRSVSGDPVTIMAGLNCGTPCTITWPIIRDRAGFYCACTDEVSENAMRELARFPKEEERVVAGESGAVTFGVLREIIKDDSMKREMGINEESIILLISTEGDTDPEGYENIVAQNDQDITKLRD